MLAGLHLPDLPHRFVRFFHPKERRSFDCYRPLLRPLHGDLHSIGHLKKGAQQADSNGTPKSKEAESWSERTPVMSSSRAPSWFENRYIDPNKCSVHPLASSLVSLVIFGVGRFDRSLINIILSSWRNPGPGQKQTKPGTKTKKDLQVNPNTAGAERDQHSHRIRAHLKAVI